MKATTVKEVLIATKWILTHMDWIQGEFFRDSNGAEIRDWRPDYLCKYAKSCCLSGAIRLVETDREVLSMARGHLFDVLSPDSITSFNDKPGLTKDQLLEALDQAIEKAP
jgi:hypothetical protein